MSCSNAVLHYDEGKGVSAILVLLQPLSLLVPLLLCLSAESGLYLFVFFFSYLGPSRLSWCSWSPRSQGSQGKRKGFPSDIDDILWHFQNEDFSLCLCRICLHYRRGSCSRITGIWEKEVLVENQCYSPLSWPLYYMLQCFLHSIFKCSGNLEGACMSPAKFQEAQTWQFSHFVGRSCIRVGNLRGGYVCNMEWLQITKFSGQSFTSGRNKLVSYGSEPLSCCFRIF